MLCTSPLKGIRAGDGSVTLIKGEKSEAQAEKRVSSAGGSYLQLLIPCRSCLACRINKSRDWVIRSVHEASLWQHNCFITLTYSPEHMPPGAGLKHEDFQLFMKRLRVTAERKFGFKDIRYLMCGEYGKTTLRPHYHAILFNLDFPDKQPIGRGGGGYMRYESPMLRELWALGHTEVGTASEESMGYVARYTFKKAAEFDNIVDKTRLATIDLQTGEFHARKPEYVRSSRRPGIGTSWLERFHEDCWKGYVTHNEVKYRLPLFYKEWLATHFPERYDAVSPTWVEKAEDLPQMPWDRRQDIAEFNRITLNQSKSRTEL
jgi:hypothetical protein